MRGTATGFGILLPLLVPPITYGIPMATVLYKAGVAGTMAGVVLVSMYRGSPRRPCHIAM